MQWKTTRIAFTFATVAALAGCGGSDTNNPPPGGKVPSVTSFTPSATMVASGDKVTLSWVVANATSVSISANPGGSVLDSSPMLMGSVDSKPITADTTFTLVATDAAGKTAMRTASVTLMAGGVTIVNFAASPNPAPLNGSTTLSWQTTGATAVRILQGSTELYPAPPEKVASGSFVVAMLTQASTTFTLVASAGTEMAMQSVTVTAAVPAKITEFTVDPPTFSGAAQDVQVHWNTTDATTVTLTANGAPAAGFTPNTATGTITVNITQTTTFELIASSGGGSETADLTVAKVVAETEPNDNAGQATALTTGAASGSLSSDTDVDWYSFTVPANGNVTAETSDGMGGCNTDTLIRLFNAAGTELGHDDESGPPGGCSLIDAQSIDADGNHYATNLPAGTYYIKVEGYQGATGDYTLVVTVGSPGCGNGILEGSESCDDGNTTAGDNCSASCQWELAATISGTGGETTVTIPPMAGQRVIKVVLATAGQSITATTSETNGGCATADTSLGILHNNRLIGYTLDGPNMSNCAVLSNPPDTYATDLEAGDYYLIVENDSDTAAADIKVVVNIGSPACGNGLVETRAHEQCDDGNAASGDGCSATCIVEPLGNLSGPPASMTFMGAIDPGTQQDVYQLTLSAQAYIVAETFTTTGTCTSDVDTILDVLDSNLSMVLAHNDDGEHSPCSTIDGTTAGLLQAGTYFVRVTSYRQRVISAYQVKISISAPGCGNGILEMGEQCDDSNTANGDGCNSMCHFEGNFTPEVEPNNAADMTATNSGVTRTGMAVTMLGAIDPAGDEDYYQIVIAGGTASLTATTHTSPMDTSVCMDIDTVITLYDSMGMEIVENDDRDFNAGNYCSQIDGTDPMMMEAHALSAGTYYLRVKAYSAADVINSYFLTLDLTP